MRPGAIIHSRACCDFVTGKTIFFLVVYTKNDFEDLPDEVKDIIRKMVAVIRREYEHEG